MRQITIGANALLHRGGLGHGPAITLILSVQKIGENAESMCRHTSQAKSGDRWRAAPDMAKKMRSTGGELEIGKVYRHGKSWRVQVKILFKVHRGPSRSSEEAANADLENLRKSGGRKEMQRLLSKLRRRIQQAKKEKSEEEKARQKLQKVQKNEGQKQEKSEPERLKRGPSIQELKMKLARAREMKRRAAQEDRKGQREAMRRWLGQVSEAP